MRQVEQREVERFVRDHTILSDLVDQIRKDLDEVYRINLFMSYLSSKGESEDLRISKLYRERHNKIVSLNKCIDHMHDFTIGMRGYHNGLVDIPQQIIDLTKKDGSEA